MRSPERDCVAAQERSRNRPSAFCVRARRRSRWAARGAAPEKPLHGKGPNGYPVQIRKNPWDWPNLKVQGMAGGHNDRQH